jgi:hypothetical protein
MNNPTQIKGDCHFPTKWTLWGPVERDAAEPDFATLTDSQAGSAMAVMGAT